MPTVMLTTTAASPMSNEVRDRQHGSRKQIASLRVRAEQKKAGLRRRALRADEVPVGGDQPEQLVLVPFCKEYQRNLLRRVRYVLQPVGIRVAGSLQPMHVRGEPALVEEVDSLRRHECPLGIGGGGVRVSQEIGKGDHEIKQGHDDGRDDREAMPHEPFAEQRARRQHRLRSGRSRRRHPVAVLRLRRHRAP